MPCLATKKKSDQVENASPVSTEPAMKRLWAIKISKYRNFDLKVKTRKVGTIQYVPDTRNETMST
jgi:hypothetical protein